MENLILDFWLNRNKIDFILAWNGWLAFAYFLLFFFSFSLFSLDFRLKFLFSKISMQLTLNTTPVSVFNHNQVSHLIFSSFPHHFFFFLYYLHHHSLHETCVNVKFKHNLSYFHHLLLLLSHIYYGKRNNKKISFFNSIHRHYRAADFLLKSISLLEHL